MSTTVYKVTPQKQLIDLNGDLTNFDITFTATCKEGHNFDALVVDQRTLDGPEPLVYKKVDQGQIGGNIISDKDVYQNFFLVLKSDEPCDVEVSVTKKSIPASPPPPVQPAIQSQQLVKEPPKSSGINWKVVLVVLILLGVAGYFFWTKYYKKGVAGVVTEVPLTSVKGPSPVASTVASPMLPPTSKFGGANADLLSRLNSLSMK